jgi:hypothetical protein
VFSLLSGTETVLPLISHFAPSQQRDADELSWDEDEAEQRTV